MRKSTCILRLLLFAFLLSYLDHASFAQAAPSQQQMQSLADTQRWNELVRLLAPVAQRSAELNFYYGLALAQLGRYAEADAALAAGAHQSPSDARFPTEMAGIAFKQKHNARAEKLLQRAVHLGPHDSYATDFLGTLYFLDGNLEAALKYWNRSGKPMIAEVRSDPKPHVEPALLDRAFTFSPASILQLHQFLATESRLNSLGVFPQYHLDLNGREDGRFDAVLRARERDGFGGGLWASLFLFFRGIPFQQVSPSYYNFNRQTINFDSMVRWDAQKRRVNAELSGPLRHGTKYRWEMSADLRNENWAVRNGFTGPAPLLAGFNLKTARGMLDIAAFSSGIYTWRVGAEISHRDLSLNTVNAALTPQMMAGGYQLKQRAENTGALLRIPERRFELNAGSAAEIARLWSQSPQTFGKLTGSLGWQWLPRPQDDDYATSQTIRTGKIFGASPFDELFILGLERDNDLLMRAHIGTRDGRKGSAPLGREYLVENWEMDKNLYSNGIAALKLGPFADIGKISNQGTVLGSHQWLFDVGAQVKLRVLGSGLVFSYGKDLRTGNNAFYLRLMEQ